MNNPFYAAVITASRLVAVCRMTVRDACRTAAHQHGVDYHKLYRALTD
jgi:hypothetical protein